MRPSQPSAWNAGVAFRICFADAFACWHRPTLLLCFPSVCSSFDQYSNIVLSNTSERKVLGSSYYDEPLGLYVIRGENVVLLGDQVRERTRGRLGEAGWGEPR